MVSTSEIKEFLKKNLSHDRYVHTLNLRKLAVKLAKHHGLGLEDIYRVELAALLHDCHKKLEQGNNHSFLAAEFTKKNFGITDRKILSAIEHHTYGHRNMSKLSKIIYLADISEPSRKFKEAKHIRKLAFADIDKAMVLALSVKMRYVLYEKKPLSLESVISYNKILKKNDARV
ncbi:MAG: bis(5'-nucleosyl)-tetraphosphatase (symmetrical) YqeK [Elusimicrobia bacterium]|nr:bis(5'-nucleosyl)-tetraphosphatase (symmetrical) YqeK [Elusimicrobiota bacterium]